MIRSTTHYPDAAGREAPIVKDNEILVRTGTFSEDHQILPREKVVSCLREAHDAERKLEKEIAERSTQLEAARAAALKLQDDFDTAVRERNKLRSSIACSLGETKVSVERMAELRAWIEGNYATHPTADHFDEYYRRSQLAAWLPKLVEAMKKRLAGLDARVAELAKQNDLAVPD